MRLRRPAAGSGWGDTPNPPGPRAPPLRRPPPRAFGGGGVGEALTSREASANRSGPSRAPEGFPGHSRDLGPDPAVTTLHPGLHRGGRGWDPEGAGRGAAARPAPAGPETGSAGGSHTAGGGRAVRSPRAPGTGAGPAGSPGPSGSLRPPRPGAAARPRWARGVSAAGARKTRTGFLPVGSGRELGAAPPAAQMGKLRPKGRDCASSHKLGGCCWLW